jgi:hypothetical protein
MGGIFDTILGVVGDAANWATGSQSNKKTQGMLSTLQQQNVIAAPLQQAQNLEEEQSNTGLPGYETMLGEEKSMLPTTLNQIRDSATSGQLMDLVTKLYTKQNQGINQLSVANATAKQQNKQKFSSFLSGPMTQGVERQQNINQGLTISKDEVRQQGVKDEQGYLGDILDKVGKGADSIIMGGGMGGGGMLGGILGGGGQTGASAETTLG